MTETIKTEQQLAHAAELKKQFDNTLKELGFSLDVEAWGDDLDLTDPNNAEIIATVIGNILIASLSRLSKVDQNTRLIDLMSKMPRELSIVRGFIHLFKDGIAVAGTDSPIGVD